MAETGWTKEFPQEDGWYWSRRSGPIRALCIHEGAVAYGSVWMQPKVNPTFFVNREWLGPLSPADAEQLVELRKALQIAIPIVRHYGKLLEHPDNRAHYQKIADDLEAALNPKQPEKETQGK